jgi:hypothetical protein
MAQPKSADIKVYLRLKKLTAWDEYLATYTTTMTFEEVPVADLGAPSSVSKV